MYICLCNAISDKQIRECAGCDKPCKVSDIYRKFDCRPQCGQCVPYVREMLSEMNALLPDADTPVDVPADIGFAAAE